MSTLTAAIGLLISIVLIVSVYLAAHFYMRLEQKDMMSRILILLYSGPSTVDRVKKFFGSEPEKKIVPALLALAVDEFILQTHPFYHHDHAYLGVSATQKGEEFAIYTLLRRLSKHSGPVTAEQLRVSLNFPNLPDLDPLPQMLSDLVSMDFVVEVGCTPVNLYNADNKWVSLYALSEDGKRCLKKFFL